MLLVEKYILEYNFYLLNDYHSLDTRMTTNYLLRYIYFFHLVLYYFQRTSHPVLMSYCVNIVKHL